MAMSIPLSVSDIQSTASTPVNINTTSNNNGSNNDGSRQEQQQQQQQQSQDQMATQSTTVSTTATATSPTSPTQVKRKPNRRANTAERRATHNAVERQRRETLNGRFLVRLSLFLPNIPEEI
jgi:hypothetical protein